MPEFFLTESRARLRTWLVLVYTLFIMYASLSPFTGWRGQGLNFFTVLREPVLIAYDPFDVVLNLLAYIPLGLLLCLALRARLNPLPAFIVTCALGSSLSASMEFLQMYLPVRTSSNLDLLTNSAGTLIGALLGLSFIRWTRFYNLFSGWRNRIFLHGKAMDFGLALLALWMFGQINPSLPMLGNVFISAAAHQPFTATASAPFNAWESAAVMLNLLMLGTLLLTLLRNPSNVINALLLVLSCVTLVKFGNAAVLLKSSAMLLWVNSEALLGILLGSVFLLTSHRFARHKLIWLGVLHTLSYLVISHFILDSGAPAVAMPIYLYNGHMLDYNGLAQTITLVFPALLLLHLWRVRNE